MEAILFFIAAGVYHGKVNWISWLFFTLGIICTVIVIGSSV